MIIAAMAALSLLGTASGPPSAPRAPAVQVGSDATTAVLQWGPVERVAGLPPGLCAYEAAGCSSIDGLLLPVRHLYVAVPPGVPVDVSATPLGVRGLDTDAAVPAAVSLDSHDCDSLHPARSGLPEEWATLVEVAPYRGIRMARVDVHPVISSGGGLLAASGIDLTVSHPGGGAPVPARGLEGRFYEDLLLGGGRVWPRPRGAGRDDSPFWGRPWAEIGLDTTGVYRLTGAELPWAVGSASSSLALYRGRGRMMGGQPWSRAYQPIPVPIAVMDGGDGVFDSTDSLVFFGTGLSWWESDGNTFSDHYTSRWDHRNSYWLTWGGDDGARMDTLDGGLTGAPAMPDTFPARIRLEKEYFWLNEDAPSWWAWFKVFGSQPAWLEQTLQTPGATGPGTLRVGFVADVDGPQDEMGTEVYLNGELLADTVLEVGPGRVLEVPASNFSPQPSQLSVKVWRESGNDIFYVDWIEAHPWTACHAQGQLHLPLEWYMEEGRRRFTWQGDLDDALVLFVERDSTASLVGTSHPSSFEVDVGERRTSRSVWITSRSDLLAPASVDRRSPGRIVGALEGAERVFICHEDFRDGALPLQEPGVSTAFVTTREIYQEFNGGPADPQAIRVFLDWAMSNWDPQPLEVVLVGSGHYDMRGFGTDEPCYVPVIYGSTKGYPYDDRFAELQGSGSPQVAMSRICVLDSQELAVVVEKSQAYRSGGAPGEWQGRVIGAADDERYPDGPSYHQFYHTRDMERVMTESVPHRYLPVKCYEVFFDWNEQWRKPEARQDFIDQWNLGAIIVGFLGHGAHDQICDEGFLFLEDVDLLQCGRRMPYSYFGSCDVGEFYKPDRSCIAQATVTVADGGSVVSCGAVGGTGSTGNRNLLMNQVERMLAPDPLPFDLCLLQAKLETGYVSTTRQYILFGDGTLTPAVPEELGPLTLSDLLTGEASTLEGQAPGSGLVSVLAFESAQPDTYVTAVEYDTIPYISPFRHQLPLSRVSTARAFFSGSSPAGDLELSMFVPLDADTGSRARVHLFLPDGPGFLGWLYPENLGIGSPSSSDTTGPSMEMWIQGFRGVGHPEVGSDVVVVAELADSSGINLLSEPGRQLTLYVDDSPQAVAAYFDYLPGSSTTGRLEVPLSGLSAGEHDLRLRAADGLNNISYEEMGFTVLDPGDTGLSNVFVYPNPCPGGASVNWTQTGSGYVRLEIYTVSGRRVLSRSGIPGHAGSNQIWWDGRDNDGDPVASGSYIYRLAAEKADALEGAPSQHTGVLAVVR
ncbi:MAG: C25 family cysteine peptidase [Candidatus Fermentibacteraceae bacterium]